MIYLSDILFPLPMSFAWVAHASPAYYFDRLLFAAAGEGGGGASLVDVAVLAGVTLLL